jgi:hypothetical protein
MMPVYVMHLRSISDEQDAMNKIRYMLSAPPLERDRNYDTPIADAPSIIGKQPQ